MTHRHHGITWPRVVLVAIGCGAVAGCAARQPEPVRAPAAPRALTISAQRRQSQAQQDRDKGDCQSIASAQATSSESWAQIFSGCMSGRGYLVE